MALRWTYSRSSFGHRARDAAWVDQVVFVKGPELPVLAPNYEVDGAVGKAVDYAVVTKGGPSQAFSWSGDWPIGQVVDPVSGKISGVPREPGKFTLQLKASNSAGDATAVVHFVILTAYEAFAQGLGALADPFSDPDKDGLPNVVEFLLGTDPQNASANGLAQLPAAVRNSGEPGAAFQFPDPPLQSGLGLAFEVATEVTSKDWAVVVKRDVKGAWTAGVDGWKVIAPALPDNLVRIQPPSATPVLFGRWRLVILK